ncbi:uncharacterized protein LOC122672107 [Telopea speciosissima]|uniref:uncharacterized protein LOC122672107 n=1 Tax=Telopea speciosissima TaxID=54955 RepID=UPI001CC70866|nr:uncharacterized protein LOC122672107 [Telopea speciosissima]
MSCWALPGPQTSFNIVKASLSKQWKATGSLDLFLLDNGVFIFKFYSEEVKAHALDGAPWMVSSKPIFLRQWSPYVLLHKVDLNSIPLWVTLPGLPLHYWSQECLSRIGSVIGYPLYIDARTLKMDRLSFARIYVDVSADCAPPSSITISEEDGFSFVQSIRFDWLPPHCIHCKLFGHYSHDYSGKTPISFVAQVSSEDASATLAPLSILDAPMSEPPGSSCLPTPSTVCPSRSPSRGR